MTIDYNSILSVEQKRSLLQQRITQFAAEAYQHSLNRKTCEGLEDTAGVENADKSLQILEAAISVHQAELDSLPAAE
ncbi:MAG: hypothetical protein ACO3UU_00940 [Minisyncoccia bacterium]